MGRLDGKLAVVSPGGGDAAAGLAADGAAVLVAGEDAAAVGELVVSLRAAGARAAGFVGDVSSPADRTALLEMATELFPGWDVTGLEAT